MAKVPTYLLQRMMASRMLDVLKMKAVVPCVVSNRITGYSGRVTEIVLDPLRLEDVDESFRAQGYNVADEFHVLATTADDGILVWGGLNSVYHLRKGDKIVGFSDHLAFNDILDLTSPFKFKTKKVELDALMAQLKAKYTKSAES